MKVTISFVLSLAVIGLVSSAPTKDTVKYHEEVEDALKKLVEERGFKVSSHKRGKENREPPEEAESPDTLESDMKLTRDQLQFIEESVKSTVDGGVHKRLETEKRKAILHERYRWPKAMVPYIFDSSLGTDYENAILLAMKHIEDRSCVRFHPKSTLIAKKVGHNAYVKIHRGNGCYSDVGKRGDGEQEVSIGTNCHYLGTVVHELMHTLGFYHEQSRYDRDDYLIIHKERIKPDNFYNFQKYKHDEIKSFGIPYDYTSVMHYKGTYFAIKSDDITMETRDPAMQRRIGQRSQMSFLDSMSLNNMYSCNEHCVTHTACENNGFIGPDCSCVCPDGLAGVKCTDVAPTASPCGDLFTDPTGTITTPSYPKSYGNSRDCNWLIQGPPGSTITLTFDDFDIEDDWECHWDYLEIRSYGPHHGGPRICGKGPKEAVVYNGTSLVVQFHSDDTYDFKGFKISYKINSSGTVNGGWSDWNPWTKCSKSCGTGLKLRQRYCNNPAPANGGQKCNGDDIDFATCNMGSC